MQSDAEKNQPGHASFADRSFGWASGSFQNESSATYKQRSNARVVIGGLSSLSRTIDHRHRDATSSEAETEAYGYPAAS
jgi:hypothetical protein